MNQADINGAKKVFLGGLSNGDPNHCRNTKTYIEKAGGDILVAGIIVAAAGTFITLCLDWLVKPLPKPSSHKIRTFRKR